MRDTLTAAGLVVSPPVTPPVTVRLRCLPCEVAWSGPAESTCWICGEDGTPSNTAIVVRARGGLASFDLELFA